MLGTLVQGRVCVGGGGLNAAKVALAIAIRYGLRRRQFEATTQGEEDLLLDYGQHQRRLFPLLARTYALDFAQEIVAGAVPRRLQRARGGDEKVRRELESRAAGTKALATWHATRTIQECREACGGAGYLSVNRFAALKADTDVFTTFEGDNTVLLQLVAKGLLTDYSSEFEEMDQLGMVRFVTGLAVETVIERTNAHKLLERVARPAARRRPVGPGGRYPRLRLPAGDAALPRGAHAGRGRPAAQAGIDNKMNPGEVFSRVQDHVIHAARAHVERLVLEAFVEKVRAMEDPGGTRSRWGCSATCTRCRSSRTTGPGSWSTAG